VYAITIITRYDKAMAEFASSLSSSHATSVPSSLAAGNPLLSLSHITVQYGKQQAVSEVSFSLAKGEIGVLLGPSGCGKTSLLRAIGGFVPLSEGEVSVAGTVLSTPQHQVAPEKRKIGLVFQDFALFTHLNVQDNIAFGLRALPSREREAAVLDMLQLVGLQGVEANYPHQLSGGQQQRVALARALAPKPELLLLDEPFSSLDAELRDRLAHDVRGILKASRTTALVVTHDQFEAFALGDRVGVMNHGKLEQWDTPYRLYHQPQTRFVADFIGDGVVLPAVAHQDQHNMLANVSIELGVLDGKWLGKPLNSGESRHCNVLLRSDDVVHDDDSELKATVVRKAFRGADFLYTLKLPSGAQIYALVPSHHDHAIGEPIGIKLAADHVVTFE
jgi:iron(III) transport system ATP-binding protein